VAYYQDVDNKCHLSHIPRWWKKLLREYVFPFLPEHEARHVLWLCQIPSYITWERNSNIVSSDKIPRPLPQTQFTTALPWEYTHISL